MAIERVIGWDIGGAHLKMAWIDAEGRLGDAVQVPCPLWKGESHLLEALTTARARLVKAGETVHAITMTGELADLFADRAQGVRRIVACMSLHAGNERLCVYGGRAGFLDPAQTDSMSEAVASMNWRASAQWTACQLAHGLLLDIGSTTTDLVPFRGGDVDAAADNDYDRLRTGELLYTGVVRSPVANLAARVPLDGQWMPMVAEQFATSSDVHRLTGDLPDDADQQPTADGGAKTLIDTARRLARMVGRDSDKASLEIWRRLARFLSHEQSVAITRAAQQVLSAHDMPADCVLVGAGIGRFLAPAVAQRLGLRYMDFGRLCGTVDDALRRRAADCAPAVSIAHLARAQLCGADGRDRP